MSCLRTTDLNAYDFFSFEIYAETLRNETHCSR